MYLPALKIVLTLSWIRIHTVPSPIWFGQLPNWAIVFHQLGYRTVPLRGARTEQSNTGLSNYPASALSL